MVLGKHSFWLTLSLKFYLLFFRQSFLIIYISINFFIFKVFFQKPFLVKVLLHQTFKAQQYDTLSYKVIKNQLTKGI